MAMDVVDYEIKGSEMQFVEVELDPGEAAIGEAAPDGSFRKIQLRAKRASLIFRHKTGYFAREN